MCPETFGLKGFVCFLYRLPKLLVLPDCFQFFRRQDAVHVQGASVFFGRISKAEHDGSFPE